MSETKWIKRTEVAKIIRKDLKTHFPKTKFSVKSDSGSIRVSWDNGPTENQVDLLISKYTSKGFDGMIDLEYYYDHYELPDGTIYMYKSEGTTDSRGYRQGFENPLPSGAVCVSLNTGYLFTNRTVTDDWVLRISKAAKAHYGALEDEPEPKTTEDLGKSFSCFDGWNNWYQIAYRIHQKLDLTDAVDVVEDPDFRSGGFYDGFLVVKGGETQ